MRGVFSSLVARVLAMYVTIRPTAPVPPRPHNFISLPTFLIFYGIFIHITHLLTETTS